MNFKSRDVITGFIVLVILIVGIVYIFKYRNKNQIVVPVATPNITEKIKGKFNGITIPDDIAKTELKDVTGGSAMGLSTDTEVLADLPDLMSNEFYQVWENSDGKYLSLGKMRIAKGGFLYEGNLKNKKVVVSREKIFDNNLEVKILE